MAHQDVSNAVLLEQFVIDRQHGPTGIAKYHFNPLFLKGFEDNRGSEHWLVCDPGLGHGTL